MSNWCHARSGGFVPHTGDSKEMKGQHVMSSNLLRKTVFFKKNPKETSITYYKNKQVRSCHSLKWSFCELSLVYYFEIKCQFTQGH